MPNLANNAEKELSIAKVAMEKIKSHRQLARNNCNDSKVTVSEKPERIIRTGPSILFVFDTNQWDNHHPSFLFRFSE